MSLRTPNSTCGIQETINKRKRNPGKETACAEI